MNELKFRRKLERLEAVKHGQWRDKEGVIFDLYNIRQVPDAYLETIILTCEKWENEDKTDIDNQIVSLLQEIRKQRDISRNSTKNKAKSIKNKSKKNKTKKMKNEQMELTGIETAQAAVAASANAAKNEKNSRPQMFKVGDVVKNREILKVQRSIKGKTGGWVYTTKHLKTGVIQKIKQSKLMTRDQTRQSKSASKAQAIKQFEVSTIVREEFPKIRKITSSNGSSRYIVDSRYNKSYPQGDTEFFGSSDAAFSRALEIEQSVNRKLDVAGKTLKQFEETPIKEKNETQASEPAAVSAAPVSLKNIPFFTKLKMLFS